MNNDSAESAELDSVRTCRADGKIKYLLRPIHQHQQWNERKNEDEEKVLFLVQKLVAKQWREREPAESCSLQCSVSAATKVLLSQCTQRANFSFLVFLSFCKAGRPKLLNLPPPKCHCAKATELDGGSTYAFQDGVAFDRPTELNWGNWGKRVPQHSSVSCSSRRRRRKCHPFIVSVYLLTLNSHCTALHSHCFTFVGLPPLIRLEDGKHATLDSPILPILLLFPFFSIVCPNSSSSVQQLNYELR